MSNILVWILMGLLFVSLAGFGINSFTGGSGRVGSVGDVEISAQDYFRAVQNEIRAQVAQSGQPVRFADLQARGVDDQILAGLIARAALANAADEMGISVGDEEVARQITQVQAFQGLDGNFDRNTYQFVLEQQGATAREFEADTREDVSRALLQTAVVGGISAPDMMIEAIVAYQGETRDFTRLTLTEADLIEGVPEPTEADLAAFYDDNPDMFERPEARRIQYVWLRPSDLIDDVEIAEETLRELYDDRQDVYAQPERRLLERLVFGTEEAAQEAFDAIAAGETDFDTLVEERDLTLDDVDIGEIARGDLSAAAAEAIFGDTESEIIGPVETSLGPALFRVNAVLEETNIAFEDAVDDLREELAQEVARRDIAAMEEEVDDLLAGGATLEDIASDTQLTLGEIDYSLNSEEAIAGYDNFRDAAEAVNENDFPELLSLSDGGIFALELMEIVPPSVPPLDEITEEVAAAWRQSALRDELAARGQELVSQLATGAALEDLGDTIEERRIRRQDLLPDLPPTTVPQAFQMAEIGDVVLIPGAEAAHIVRLDAINPAARDAPDVGFLLTILEQTLNQAIATDIFEAYGQALQAEAGFTTNEAVINSVNAAFP
ncbi:peptidylprolyl isomerase [Gymnodinialimonas mytili]|uniref:peptidylprolyl isomerase n=1 Tax=Gymnodinialimonas mytili TaxID=3126503 RepID=UPI0030ED0C9F